MAASTQALITLTWATWAVSNMVLASWLLHHFDTQQLMRGNISFWLCPNLQPTSVSFPISLESSPPSLLPLSGASYLPNTVAISEWLAAGDSAPSHRTRDILLAPNFLAAFAIWKIRWAYQKRRLYFRSQMDGMHVEKAVSERALLIVSPALPSLISPFNTLGLL